MRLPRLAAALRSALLARVAGTRPPDFVIGADSPGGAYLLRWYLTPWRRLQTRLREAAEASPTRWNRLRAAALNLLPNLYLHKFLRDDDDRALHDHPSWAASLIVDGAYIEHTIAAGGIHRRRVLSAGSLRFLPTRHTHRIELIPWADRDPAPCEECGDGSSAASFERHPSAPCWTLFLFGPTVREWGFHCPERGWVHWREFTAAGKPGEIGPGCGE